MGTTEMMAVPYALSSGDGSQSATEVPYNNATSGLAATNAQEAIDELVGSGGVDADADPTNEIQTISFDAATNEINLTDGGTISIPIGGADADGDPTNELQTISFDAATNEINLTDGGTITIPSGGTDADADPANELQILNFDEGTNELSLSDGNTVTIPSGGADADADPTNELQDISLSGTDLSISEGSTVDLSAIIPPGGTDDQNAVEVPFDNAVSGLAATDTQAAIDELVSGGLVDTDDQILIFDAVTNFLEIEDGNTVDLSSLSGGSGNSLWKAEATGISYTTGNVGVGIASSIAPLTVDANSGINMSLTSSTQDNFLTFSNSGGYVGYAEAYSGDNDIDLGTSSSNNTGKVHLTTNATPKLTVAANGKVGIGTTEPTSKLEVNGDIKTSGEVHRHDTGGANMLPLAYGLIDYDGTPISGTGNFNVRKSSTGFYQIEIHHQIDSSNWVVIANPGRDNSAMSYASVQRGRDDSSFGIQMRKFVIVNFSPSNTGNLKLSTADSSFSFVVYKN